MIASAPTRRGPGDDDDDEDDELPIGDPPDDDEGDDWEEDDDDDEEPLQADGAVAILHCSIAIVAASRHNVARVTGAGRGSTRISDFCLLTSDF